MGHGEGSADDIRTLRSHVMELDAELTKLRNIVGAGESSLQLERATQKKLSQQVQSLESENATLKEDLAFFEGLMPSANAADESGVRIDRLKIEKSARADEFRYKMLVINSAGKQSREFKGTYQLLVRFRRNGSESAITIPAGNETNLSAFRMEVKNFHRIEGVFEIPAGGEIVAVEARLLQDGVVRTKQLQAF